MRKMIVLIVLFANGFIFFLGCKKDKDADLEYDTQTSQDNALAESAFSDITNMTTQAMENGILTTYKNSQPANYIQNSCAAVTVVHDSTGNGGSIEIDFGTTPCRCQGIICSDTRYRKGKIHITYSGPYRNPGTVIHTSFENYFVGVDASQMFQISGTKTVTNQGYDPSQHLHFQIVVDGHIKNPSGATMDWTSQRYREWISGQSTTADWRDDEYIVTGTANGTNFEGTVFSTNIVSGLHVALSCPNIKQGVFELTPYGKPTRTLDYGDGTCDANATVTVNGTSFPVVLR